jgi:signal transduction histidine kinase
MSRRTAPPQAPPGEGISSDVRHDLRHELATLRTLFAVAQDEPDLDPAELRSLLATATGEVSYALDLLDAVPQAGSLPAAGPSSPAPRTDLAAVLSDAAAVARGGVVVHVEAVGPLYVSMPRTALVRVVRNLLGNAVAALDGTGTVLLRAECIGADGPVRLEIHDDGPGPGRSGFSPSGGQGLTVVRTLVLTAGGSLVLGRSPSGGTCASVTLPVPRQEFRP